jgi:purine-binding chemotaxis protein CheW
MENETTSEINSYLSFRIGKELFAAHVSKVINILEMTKITTVPRAPEYMLGVINLRGAVLPVIDARTKFGMPKDDNETNHSILVTEINVEGEPVKVGAVVDNAEEVLEVEADEIMPPPSIGSQYKTEFIKGVIQRNDEFIMILDMDNIFSSEEALMIKSSNKEKV